MTNPKIAKASAWFFFGWSLPRNLLAKAVQKQLFIRVLLLVSQSAAESLMIIVNDKVRISLMRKYADAFYTVKRFFLICKMKRGVDFVPLPFQFVRMYGSMRSPCLAEKSELIY